MREHAIDALARHSANAVTRRASMMTIGAAGLAALFAGSAATEAKKKTKKKELAKCQGQVAPCQGFAAANDPTRSFCCDLLATCDYTGFAQCAFVATT